MIKIYAPAEQHEVIQNIINKEDRLDELVTIHDLLDERPLPSAFNILTKNGEIALPLDWYNEQPPLLLSEHYDLNEANLLGIIFAKLGNQEKAEHYLQKSNPTLLVELNFIERLKNGFSVSSTELTSQYSPYEDYRLMHNHAIVNYYNDENTQDHDKTAYYFSEALSSAPSEEYEAFSARQYANFLMDLGQYENAAHLLSDMMKLDISREGKIEIQYALCQSWLQQLVVPYDTDLLDQLKHHLWEVLTAYEDQGRTVESAMVLLDAGIVANYSESWSESLGYLDRAIKIFETEGLSEMVANTQYRKGVLLFTWAKKGNPQFMRKAAETLQKALRVFNRDNAPFVYADIQHLLGMIYAAVPDDIKKKGLWAGISSSAFQEALEIYTKTDHPYEYAMICNHYGNALVTYPEAKLTDNVEKALYYYQESLEIRSAAQFPTERCLTLLNYLEAQWFLSMPKDEFDESRYQDMLDKATEAMSLAPSEQVKAEAEGHLDKLKSLKAAYS